MPAEELIMRGKTAADASETLSFGGLTPGYGYHLTEFRIWPSTTIHAVAYEMTGCITAAKTAADPESPNFDEPGLIGNAWISDDGAPHYPMTYNSLVNNLFVITQDLILSVRDGGGSNYAINWQCKFEKVKLSDGAEAVANFNQFTIFDD